MRASTSASTNDTGDPTTPTELHVGQHHAGLVPDRQSITIDASAVLEATAVTDHRSRAELHRGAGDQRAPAQVDVLTTVRDVVAEPADHGEQVGPDEHAGGRDGEHVARLIVLRLVEFTRIHQFGGRAVAVDAETDRGQEGGVVPVDELRPDHTGIGAERLGDHGGDRLATQHHVVVTEQQERSVVGERPGLVGRCREPLVGVAPDHPGVGQRDPNPVVEPLSAAVVDDDDRQLAVLLTGERPQGVLEPWSGVAGHHDGDHGGSAGADDGGVRGQSPLGVLVGVVLVGLPLEARRTALGQRQFARCVRVQQAIGGVAGRLGLVRIDRNDRNLSGGASTTLSREHDGSIVTQHPSRAAEAPPVARPPPPSIYSAAA